MPRYAWCLAALVAGLLSVGVESGTPVRHLIQVLPALWVLILAMRRTPWAADAAVSVFAVWLLFMTLIWLFLLGLAHVITGHFPPVEIVLTVLIGAAAAAGLFIALRASGARWPIRLLTMLLFALVQLAAVWLSLRPGLARM